MDSNIINDEDIIVINGKDINKIESFDKFEFKEEINNAIVYMGYEKPSKIQSYAIPIIMKGKDLVMQSQTGSGETIAFLLSTLQAIDCDYDGCQVIIISNSRELAIQTTEVFDALTENIKYATRTLILEYSKIDNIKTKYIIGTPYEVLETLKSQINTEKIKCLIIDEADDIIKNTEKQRNMEAKTPYESVKAIKDMIPKETQTILVSATYPQTLKGLENEFVNENNVAYIEVSADFVPKTITQFYLTVPKNEKVETIVKIFDYFTEEKFKKTDVEGKEMFEMRQVIVFASTEQEEDDLYRYMKNRTSYRAYVLKSKNNDKINKIMKRFRNREFQFLITNDVISRKRIDIDNIGMVINLEFPYKYDEKDNKTNQFDIKTYIHRISITGRFEKKGIAITFVTEDEQKKIKEMEMENKLGLKYLETNKLEQIHEILKGNLKSQQKSENKNIDKDEEKKNENTQTTPGSTQYNTASENVSETTITTGTSEIDKKEEQKQNTIGFGMFGTTNVSGIDKKEEQKQNTNPFGNTGTTGSTTNPFSNTRTNPFDIPGTTGSTNVFGTTETTKSTNNPF